ncbi:uncharacterized protein BDW70DRAFT_143659 [Aspergillus foveolatus]|uniref:uncharacterized protein n=1 Tax=Aspergillus foveolatus TaxID=210207 RepID=UPI003CCD3EBB
MQQSVRYARGSGLPFLCRLTMAKYILLVGGGIACVCMLRRQERSRWALTRSMYFNFQPTVIVLALVSCQTI